jgi:hypothetical protein
MEWEVSIWNYHKLALIVSLWVFILVSPPVYKFISSNMRTPIWTAIVIALLVWSFVFIILHTFSGKSKITGNNDDMM